MSCTLCIDEPLPAQPAQVGVKLTAASVLNKGLLLAGNGPMNNGLVTVPPGELPVFQQMLPLAVSGLALKCMQPLSKIELVTVMLEPLSTSTLHCELSP